MNDPFAPVSPTPFTVAQQQGQPTVGYGVLDAPDQSLREIAIKVQQGQALSNDELSRLARRQGVELETQRVAAGAGAPGANIGRSVAPLLAGTSLDSSVQNARVLAADPLGQVRTELAAYGLDPSLAGTTAGADTLANAKIRQSVAAQAGIPVEDASLAMTRVAVPEPAPQVLAPVVNEAVSAPVAVSPLDRVKGAVGVVPIQLTPKQVQDQELQRRLGGRTVSIGEIRRVRDEVRQQTLPEIKTRSVIDPLTRDVYEVEVQTDKLGNVYSVGEPAFKTAGPNKKLDEDFQPEVNKWITGGSQQLQTNVAQLQEAIKTLENPSTSAVSGALISLVPDALRVRLSPESAAVQARVEGVMQQSLREILGGQFAQKEGEQLLKRAFDPRVPEEENARRAKVLLGTLSGLAADKQAAVDYFRQHGTIQGFTGHTSFTHNDVNQAFEAGLKATEPSKTSSPNASEAAKAYLQGG